VRPRGRKSASRDFLGTTEPVSALQTLAKPYRIKVAHRRRGKVASGPIVQRYYDPAIGRFLSVDPVTAYEKPLTNFNRYAYGFNNPYKFTDPDGRDGGNFYTDPNLRMAQPGPEGLSIVVGLLPVVGDIQNVIEAVQNPTLGNIAIAALGAIPEVGGVAAQAIKGTSEAGHFIRFGKAAESAEKLGADAAKAEKAGLPHGVSVKAQDRVSHADMANHRVATKAEAKAQFNVTQTGREPHHTVELPKPVTDEVAKRFNEVFK
jgi:RHS repeat-associated protein